MKVVAAGVIAFLAALGIPRQTSDLYTSPDFGITVRYPMVLRSCSGIRDGVNHGIAVFLDVQDQRPCDDHKLRREMVIFSFYNSSDATATLDLLNQSNCDGGDYCSPGPAGLDVGGLQTKSIRIEHPDGWIGIAVSAQGGDVFIT